MAFRADLKVCFSDIDHAGIVYYPRFLHYFHVALEELFSSELGIDYPTVLNKYRVGFPTVHLETDFRHPLRYGDLIQVEVSVLDIGQTSVTWGYTTYKRGEPEIVVVSGHNVTVCLNMDTFRKTELPEWLRQRLTDYQKKYA
ncbi:acyl-CoA thioesterase [Desulfonema magnum]|uniref:4-Hydroxybenzoyl-CoA thioesterase n=1 Tax=Desulfonema magnum TaxID=45655 RepID=A0A975GSS5_9BACT|nr:thioesterase family protein [Desulfonema magnum]QTA91378.1 4-Hydroxybenzoyl-CoA thioesterase [Desulfonema magnum]